MCYEEGKITAEYACTSYDFILPCWTWFTGEQFASEIEAHFGLNLRTQAVVDAVKSLVTKIYRTPAVVQYSIKNKQTYENNRNQGLRVR